MLIQLFPELKILNEGSQSMYFNVKVRGYPLALEFGRNPKSPALRISSDFADVSAMEVVIEPYSQYFLLLG